MTVDLAQSLTLVLLGIGTIANTATLWVHTRWLKRLEQLRQADEWQP